MALVQAIRVKVSTTTDSTDDFGIGTPPNTSFQSFDDAGVTDGDQVDYVAWTGTQFEAGTGTYDDGTTTLSRDTIDASSDGGAKVDFTESPTLAITFLPKRLGGSATDLFVDDDHGIFSTESGNPALLLFESVPDAVNYLTIKNAATSVDHAAGAGGPRFEATGSDTDVPLSFVAKGACNDPINFYTGSADGASVNFFGSGPNNGPNFNIVYTGPMSANATLGAVNFQGQDPTFIGSQLGCNADVITPGLENTFFYFFGNIAGGFEQMAAIGAGMLVGSGNPVTDMPGLGSLSVENDALIGVGDDNYLTLSGAATGSPPTFSATGADSDIGLEFSVKGNPDSSYNGGLGGIVFDLGGGVFPGASFVASGDPTFGPSFNTAVTGASPAADDNIGSFNFYAKDSAGNLEIYSAINTLIVDPTNDAETGVVEFDVIEDGVTKSRLFIGRTDQIDGTEVPTRFVSDAVGPYFTYECINDDNFGAWLVMYHNSASPADLDIIGGYSLYGNKSGGGVSVYGGFDCYIQDAAAGTGFTTLGSYGLISGGDGVIISTLTYPLGGVPTQFPGEGSLYVENDIVVDDGLIQIPEQSTPSTPPSGVVYLYAKTDHKLYSIGSDAVERALS